MTRRRWMAEHWDETTATLAGTQAAHLARVLRAAPGEEHDLVLGARVWRAAITSVSETEVRFRLLAEGEAVPPLPVSALLAVYKFDRMEWAIEKATELGVARIQPAIAARTEKHLAQAAVRRLERWRRIGEEAARQCRRADVPEIAAVAPLADLMAAPQPHPGRLRLLLSEQERLQGLRPLLEREQEQGGGRLREVEIAVGPEGGWSGPELARFEEAGWQAVSLGPRILRAETAAISALSVLAAFLA